MSILKRLGKKDQVVMLNDTVNEYQEKKNIEVKVDERNSN
tara:strand:+ start:220 stop:339 length:120 start_codon:yes stop_codon:yes gene_type:complete